MSWLSDHLFGSAKPNEQKTAENKPSNGDVAEQMEAGTNTEPEEAAPRPFATTESTGDNLYDQREVVAEWRVPLHGKLHKIEFEHGTTTGKRVLWIDEKVMKISVHMHLFSLHCNNKRLFCAWLGGISTRLDV